MYLRRPPALRSPGPRTSKGCYLISRAQDSATIKYVELAGSRAALRLRHTGNYLVDRI
jgi:hypothetical protein